MNIQDYTLAELKLIKANKEDEIKRECAKGYDCNMELACDLTLQLGEIVGVIQDKITVPGIFQRVSTAARPTV